MIDHVRFVYRGLSIEAWCIATGVTTVGNGPPSNAAWEIGVDGARYGGVPGDRAGTQGAGDAPPPARGGPPPQLGAPRTKVCVSRPRAPTFSVMVSHHPVPTWLP